jgi:hypothetical protein
MHRPVTRLPLPRRPLLRHPPQSSCAPPLHGRGGCTRACKCTGTAMGAAAASCQLQQCTRCKWIAFPSATATLRAATPQHCMPRPHTPAMCIVVACVWGAPVPPLCSVRLLCRPAQRSTSPVFAVQARCLRVGGRVGVGVAQQGLRQDIAGDSEQASTLASIAWTRQQLPGWQSGARMPRCSLG